MRYDPVTTKYRTWYISTFTDQWARRWKKFQRISIEMRISAIWY